MAQKEVVAHSYLKSGTNELKILEYSTGDLHFGINILKTSRVLSPPAEVTRVVEAHPSVLGVIDDHNSTIPIIDLASFLGLRPPPTGPLKGRIIVTEFFGQVNGFLIETIHYVHTILWENVFDSAEILGNLGSHYVIGIVRPDPNVNILLIDYETMLLEMAPQMRNLEKQAMFTEINERGIGRRILIAEDSPAVRDMLTMEMSEQGFEVVQAKDGLEGWEAFQADPEIFMVISDVEMPQMDGLSLTKKVKTMRPQTPVIVYSSIGDIGMKERAREMMADAHVTKLNFEELIETINRLLEENLPQ
jgi:two-component system chemotaxis response regulator CheV